MVMTFGVLTANAATNTPRGSFDELSSVTKFNVEVDWSQLSINGLTPEEWVRFRNAEQPQYDAEEELERELKMRWVEMITEANDKLNKKHYYLFADDEYIYDYTLVVQPIHIDKKGNQLVLCIIKHEADDREVVRFSVKWPRRCVRHHVQPLGRRLPQFGQGNGQNADKVFAQEKITTQRHESVASTTRPIHPRASHRSRGTAVG